MAWHSGEPPNETPRSGDIARVHSANSTRGEAVARFKSRWGHDQKSQLRAHACFCKQLVSRIWRHAAHQRKQAVGTLELSVLVELMTGLFLRVNPVLGGIS
jgi:hypothetical protein